MQIAVLIYCYRLRIAYADHRLRLVCKVDTDTSGLCLDINECDVMLRKHRMRHAAHLDLDLATIELCYNRNMLLVACIHCIRDQLLHLLAAANNWNT